MSRASGFAYLDGMLFRGCGNREPTIRFVRQQFRVRDGRDSVLRTVCFRPLAVHIPARGETPEGAKIVKKMSPGMTAV
jgi:hypothetical protein